MGAHRVVVDPPAFDDPPGLCERRKYMLIEAFVAQLSIERLNKRILNRLTRRNVIPLDARLFDPAQHSSARQLGCVVRDDHQWLAMQFAKSIQFPDDPRARQGCVNHARQTLPRKVVDDVKDAEATTVVVRILHKVQRPPLVGALRHGHRSSRA